MIACVVVDDGGAGVTLRQAIVLWTEDDPRAVGGEIELVEREA